MLLTSVMRSLYFSLKCTSKIQLKVPVIADPQTSPAAWGFFLWSSSILSSCIPSKFMIWMIKFIHGETASQERKKKGSEGCDSYSSPLLQQEWRRCSGSSTGFVVYFCVCAAYWFTKPHQVRFVLNCVYAGTLWACPLIMKRISVSCLNAWRCS